MFTFYVNMNKCLIQLWWKDRTDLFIGIMMNNNNNNDSKITNDIERQQQQQT